MHLVRSVADAQKTCLGESLREEEVLRQPGAAVHLNGPVDYSAGHGRHYDLDDSYFGAGSLVSHGIHHPRRLERHQASLFDVAARLPDRLPDGSHFRKRGAEGDAPLGAGAHAFQRAFGKTDEAHAMVDASGAEAALRDLKSAAFAEQHV